MKWKMNIVGWGVGLGLVLRSLAALPISDSFEFQPNGSVPAASNGWGVAGPSQAWVTNTPAQTAALLNWAFQSGVGYPISDVSHTQFLDVNGSVSNLFGTTGEQSLWFDFMLAPQAWTGAAPPALSASALCAFYVTPEGNLGLARSSEPGVPVSNLWTVLTGVGIATDVWTRITVQWVGGVDAAFFSVRLNGGSPISHASGWTMPDETSLRNGPWFPCPNAAARLTPASFNLSGTGHFDDWHLSNIRPSFDPTPIPTAVITPLCDTEMGSIAPGAPVEVPAGQTPQFDIQAQPHTFISALFTNSILVDHDFGTDRTGRFNFVWTSVPVGWHTLEAVFEPERTSQHTSIPWLLRHYPGVDDFEGAAETDMDGDAQPAWMEYLAGTDPDDPRSLFQISGQGVENGSNYLMWVSWDEAGLPPFVIRRKIGLTSPLWQDVGSQPRSTHLVTNVWFDPNSVTGSYYRIEVQEP